MTNPKTTLHDVILQTWISAFGDHEVTYLSGPITTGPRFEKWHDETKGGSKPNCSSKFEAVIQPNSEELIAAAKEIRLYWRTPIVEPASFSISEWSQPEYLKLWVEFIEKHCETIIFLPSWESSVGCVTEFTRAISHGKRTVRRDGTPISIDNAMKSIGANLDRLSVIVPRPDDYIKRLKEAYEELAKISKPKIISIADNMTKDESLDILADQINVAQFVSFRPESGQLTQKFSRIRGQQKNAQFGTNREAISKLFELSVDKSINVRSYAPGDSQSKHFEYGIKSVDAAMVQLEKLNAEGLWTIANETIAIEDGGVSGVIWDHLIEFGPDDTPRIVEKPDSCSLYSGMGIRILETVYGFVPDLVLPRSGRLEFSLHPKPMGWLNRHTVGWEFEAISAPAQSPKLSWPNRFSQLIGDKAFGLLVAHELGLNVPRTTVFSRRIAPFSFGRKTSTSEIWLRTAPAVQNPGEYTTNHGWIDPFELLKREDPNGNQISSILSQDGVLPQYSGASIILENGSIQNEGIQGAGDDLMLGKVSHTPLPNNIVAEIALVHKACEPIGPVRFEWVFDGAKLWVVQLHNGATISSETEIVPGEASEFVEFDPSNGLQELKRTISAVPDGAGILLTRPIGFTSHFADVLRRWGRPSRFATKDQLGRE